MRKLLLYLSLPFALLVGYPGVAAAQECLKTFFMDITNGQNMLFGKDGIRTSDNGFAFTGYNLKTDGPVLIKLDDGGNIKWSKGYEDMAFSRHLLNTKDGNFILTSTGPGSVLLIKYNNQGSEVWAREIIGGGRQYFKIETIKELQNGDMMLLLSEGYGGGGMRNFLVRLNSIGEFVWKRELFYESWTPMTNCMFVDDTHLYLVADFYFPLEAFHHVDVVQVNLATGAFGWRRRIGSNTEFFDSPEITKVGNEICISTVNSREYESGEVDNFSMITILDAGNGHLKNAFMFSKPTLHYSHIIYTIDNMQSFSFSNTPDNKLLKAQLMIDGSDTALQITKFETNGTVIWSKKYPKLHHKDIWSIQTDGDGFLLTGRTFTGYGGNFDTPSSFLMRIDGDGNILPANSGAGSDCSNIPASVTIEKVTLYDEPSGFSSMSEPPFFESNPYVVKERSALFTSSLRCSLNASTCNLVGIKAPEKICTGTLPVTFTGQRAAGCHLPVQWQYDTLAFGPVAQTDSSITLIPLKEGNTVLRASVANSCSGGAINRAVTISRGAASLQLGPDQKACFPPNLFINAGGGFRNYLWNTGSTDSVLQVGAAGTYWVSVTDHCDRVKNDTIAIASEIAPPVTIGPDREKCGYDSIRLQATPGFAQYEWTPDYNISSVQGASVWVFPAVDTSYYLKALALNGCFAYDTLHIRVFHPPIISLGTDTSFCEGDSVLLNAGPGFSHYQWNTGSTAAAIVAKIKYAYIVAATTAEGCMARDTLKVTELFPLPVAAIAGKDYLCAGGTETLTAGTFAAYRWQDGSTGNRFTARNTGTYTVQVTDGKGCRATDTHDIISIKSPPAQFLFADSAICSYETLVLSANTRFARYLWNTGAQTPTLEVKTPGTYWLEATDTAQCTGRDTITIIAKECVTGFFAPTAFTPNADGLNDTFRPLLYGKVAKYRFTLYNRYGEVVFSSANPLQGWDGTLKQQQQPGNVYTWICRFQFDGAEEQVEKGTVVVVR